MNNENYEIYITLDEDKIYKINNKDLSRALVDKIPKLAKNKPIAVLHKKQFDIAKNYLMDFQNPFRISIETAKYYNDIGFISKKELDDYKEEIESE